MASGDGIGTSIYMAELVKIFHHSPTHGPTEHREYKGQDGLSSFMLDLRRLQEPRAPIGSYNSLDSMLTKTVYTPISYTPKVGTVSYTPTKGYSNTYH